MADINDPNLQALAQARADAKAALDEARKKRTPTMIQNPIGGGFVTVPQKDTAAVKEAKTNLSRAESQFNQERAAIEGSQALGRDLERAGGMVSQVLGDNFSIGRLRDDAAVTQAREDVARSTDMTLLRDQASSNLSGAEQQAQRALMSQLASQGVRGGAAGGALTDLAYRNLQTRAGMERDLTLANQSAVLNRAQFETGLAQQDLSAQRAEQNIQLQTKLGLASTLQGERSAEEQERLNNAIRSTQGGK